MHFVLQLNKFLPLEGISKEVIQLYSFIPVAFENEGSMSASLLGTLHLWENNQLLLNALN